MAEIGLSLKFSSFIITPMYRYYSIDVPSLMPPNQTSNIIQGDFVRNGQGSGQGGGNISSSKSFFTVMFGYEF